MTLVRRIFVVLCPVLLLPAALSAQTVTHCLTAEVGVGYSAGVATEAGVGYAFANGLFLLRTGMEAAYTYRHLAVPDHSEQRTEIDSEGVPYTALYDYSRQNDLLHLPELRIPLLVGVQWERWYLLAGVKGGMLIGAKRHAEMDVTKAGGYAMFDDLFVDMPNHGLTVQHEFDKADIPPALTAYVTAETGLQWDYVGGALFADYRLPGYSCDSRPVDRLTIGAKLTLRIGWKVRKQQPCMCIKNSYK